jgi:hypothetical protein
MLLLPGGRRATFLPRVWCLLCTAAGTALAWTVLAKAAAGAPTAAAGAPTAAAGGASSRRVHLGLPCLVLTFNASALHPSTRACTAFTGSRFNEKELDAVAADARAKLAHPHLLQRASDLTNNASVNIYMNHARMWTHIAEHWDASLVLEDDTVLPENAGTILQELLSNLRRDNASNYIVKLDGRSSMYSQWRPVYDVGGHIVRTCTCRPSLHSASSAAYLVDRTGAQTLLQLAFPASMHVDVYMHELGCIHQKIHLHGMSPMLARTSNRPSTHMSDSLQRSYLLFKETIENRLYAEC